MASRWPSVDPFGEKDGSADAERTTLGSLGLNSGDVFGYWFDFWDDWWHQIPVLSVTVGAPRAGAPRVVHRVGASPPQYADPDDET